MKLMITENSEIVINDQRILLENGDEISINESVDKLIKNFIKTKNSAEKKKIASKLKGAGISFI